VTHLAHYQPKALATVQPAALDHFYLVNGIAGEIGELRGHVAKAYWHGPNYAADLDTVLAKELGDIAWMTAVLLHTLGQDSVTPWPKDHAPRTQLEALHALGHVGDILSSEYTAAVVAGREDEPNTRISLKAAAQTIWRMLEDVSQPICNMPFGKVLQMNIDKLKSRAERGVLQGNGDNR